MPEVILFSNQSGSAPAASLPVVPGQIAVNQADGVLFIRHPGGSWQPAALGAIEPIYLTGGILYANDIPHGGTLVVLSGATTVYLTDRPPGFFFEVWEDGSAAPGTEVVFATEGAGVTVGNIDGQFRITVAPGEAGGKAAVARVHRRNDADAAHYQIIGTTDT